MRRVLVALACTVCHRRNYETTKARRDGAPPLRLRKHCKICQKHTEHQETR